MRTLSYWLGCGYELLALPFREGPGLGFAWFLICVIELVMILHLVAG